MVPGPEKQVNVGLFYFFNYQLLKIQCLNRPEKISMYWRERRFLIIVPNYQVFIIQQRFFFLIQTDR